MEASVIISLASLLGVGSLLTGFYKLMAKKINDISVKDRAMELGMQAMLRDRIYQLYRYCNDKGFASLAERENFENMYQQYHNLGANGVMDDYRKKFFELDTEEGEKT